MSKNFIDPKTAVKFRLVYRETEDPNSKSEGDRVF